METNTLREGTTLQGIDAHGYAYFVAPASMTDEEAIEASRYGSWYGGPGSFFMKAPYVRARSKSRVLVVASIGYDI